MYILKCLLRSRSNLSSEISALESPTLGSAADSLKLCKSSSGASLVRQVCDVVEGDGDYLC